VTLRSASGYEANARSINVSLTGIGLHEVPENFPCGGIIQVLFSLEPARPPIEAKGKMTWSDRQGHTGIRFVGMSRDAQRQLKEWLELQIPD
jgi:hypothetical protein